MSRWFGAYCDEAHDPAHEDGVNWLKSQLLIEHSRELHNSLIAYVNYSNRKQCGSQGSGPEPDELLAMLAATAAGAQQRRQPGRVPSRAVRPLLARCRERDTGPQALHAKARGR